MMRLKGAALRQMSGARRHSVERDADRVRPSSSLRQINLPLVGELGNMKWRFLLLVLAADVIVATIVWFVVGSLLR